jgi:hypothetical protein
MRADIACECTYSVPQHMLYERLGVCVCVQDGTRGKAHLSTLKLLPIHARRYCF